MPELVERKYESLKDIKSPIKIPTIKNKIIPLEDEINTQINQKPCRINVRYNNSYRFPIFKLLQLIVIILLLYIIMKKD